jgi:RNA polymerase sigma factor (sigma-70 family)
MIVDSKLLRLYVDERDEVAFEEIVRRHIGLVYHAALRQTGNASLAEDVTQTVFTDLARKAGELVERASIVGWLYTSTRFAATNARRGEQRRRAREQEVFVMQKMATDAEGEATARADWERLRPVIDEALHALDERDREAMLLRFLEGRSLAEVAAKLAVKEDTARVRVTRALDKLAGLLARRGITSTATALSVALGGKAGVAAPAGLARARLKKALEASATSWPLRREKETLIYQRSVKSQVSPAHAMELPTAKVAKARTAGQSREDRPGTLGEGLV